MSKNIFSHLSFYSSDKFLRNEFVEREVVETTNNGLIALYPNDSDTHRAILSTVGFCSQCFNKSHSKSSCFSCIGEYCIGDSCVWQETDAVDDDVSEAESCSASCLGATGGSDLRVDSQLADAVRLKLEGNAFYREKNVRSAIGRYHRALLVLRGLDSDVTSSLKSFRPETPTLTSEQNELLRSTQIDCYNNLAGRCY